MSDSTIHHIAIIGTGAMGRGIAQDFAVAGFQVALHDISEEQLRQALTGIRRDLERQADWGLIARDRIEPALARLRPAASLAEAAADADLVIEAVFEDLGLKRRVFAELDRVCPMHTIVGSNTSSFMPSLLAANTTRPERMLVVHYFYPPPLMPLVEIVPGPLTAPAVIESVYAAVKAAGKTPVIARKEAMGFIVNRLQMALLREAYHLIEQGICTAAEVDLATVNSFGRRLAVVGPLELAEVQDGWDVQWEINRHIFPDLSTAAGPSPVIQAQIERKDLGPRTGRGFYDWPSARLETWTTRLQAALAESLRKDRQGR